MKRARLLLAFIFACAGGWLGTYIVYMNHNPLYKDDPLHGKMQTRTPDNAWKWWVGLVTGGFIGATLPYINRDQR